MQIMKLIEYLQEIIDTAHKVPVTGKIMVNKREIEETVEKITACLPDELKKAQWLLQEKDRILEDALKQADDMKRKNLENLRRKIENHDIIREARIRGEEIIALAQKDAKAMRLGARDYANAMLTQMDEQIQNNKKQMLKEVKGNVEKFADNMEHICNSKVKTIKSNIKELENIK